MTTGVALVPAIFPISMITGVAALMYLMPRLMRPDIYFAVTVTPNFPESLEGRLVLRQYRARVVVHYLIALGLAFVCLRFDPGLAPLLGIVWQLGGTFSAYYRARKQVMPHAVAPTTIREAELRPTELRLPGGWIGQVGPFAMLTAAGLYLHTHWAEIPARFPISWGPNGEPTGWATRSFLGVYGLLLVGLVVCASAVLLAWCTLYWSRRIETSGPSGEAETRFRLIVLGVLLGCEYVVALNSSYLAVLFPFPQEQGKPNLLPLVLLTLAFVAATALVLIRTGQGGIRLARPAGSAADREVKRPPVGDRTLDRYWKAGIIYVNPDDPALLVQKRFGLGYTLNFGRPGAWVIMALLLLLLPLLLHFLR